MTTLGALTGPWASSPMWQHFELLLGILIQVEEVLVHFQGLLDLFLLGFFLQLKLLLLFLQHELPDFFLFQDDSEAIMDQALVSFLLSAPTLLDAQWCNVDLVRL